MRKNYRFQNIILLVVLGILICSLTVGAEHPIIDQETINQIIKEVKGAPTKPIKEEIAERWKILQNLIISLNKQGNEVANVFTPELDTGIRNSIQRNDLVKAASLIDEAFDNLEQVISQKQTPRNFATESKQFTKQQVDEATKPKQIDVLLDDEKGTVKNILGVIDPPVSPLPNIKRVSPENRFNEIGIKYVTLGQATNQESHAFQKYIALDAIFLNNSKDAADRSNYDFRLVDKAIDSIIKNGITPMFQLLFDINCYKDNCGGEYPERTIKAEGYMPDDYDKWADVAMNVIKHFNGLFDVPKQARKYSAGDVKYFIVWDEPSDWHKPKLGKFQYGQPLWTGNFDDFWRLYQKLINKIETDLEMNTIRKIIKISGPSADYGVNQGDASRRFANKVIESKTRLDFISQDFYTSDFWNFLNHPIWGGMTAWHNLHTRIKNSDKRYSGLEWHLNAFNFQPLPSWQGYLEPGNPFYYPDANLESHYGSALLASYLIYSEGIGLDSFTWHGGQGDYGGTPLMPLGFGKLFNGKAKLMYSGLAFKMFSKILSFDDKPAIKVTSKGDEFNYSGDIIPQALNRAIGYRNQDVIQVLPIKQKDKKKLKILIANWNIDTKKNRYDSYNIKIKGTLDGEYRYKVFAIDKSHTFPERWTARPTWDIGDINRFPKEVQKKIPELENRFEELLSVYYPDRKDDRSVQYEGELGVAEEKTVNSSNNEINLQVLDVTSPAVHLIDLYLM